jgi:hypothetical protein
LKRKIRSCRARRGTKRRRRTSCEHSGNLRGTFREHSEAAGREESQIEEEGRVVNIQGTFREHSGNNQGTIREQSGNNQGTFREYLEAAGRE